MQKKELTMKEAADLLAKLIADELEKNEELASAAPDELTESQHIAADDPDDTVSLCDLYGHNWGDSEDGSFFCVRCGEEQY